MIIEYVNKGEDNISCQVNVITENNIMHVIESLSIKDLKPTSEKNWNFYLNEEEKITLFEINYFKMFLMNVDRAKIGSIFHPGLGRIKFYVTTFKNIDEMNEHYEKEHFKWVESVKKLDPTAEYDEELEIFKLK